MNRKEAFEHFKARILDKEDNGAPFESIVGYVMAGILTNSDYAKLVEINRTKDEPKMPFVRKVKKMAPVKWDAVVHGRRGIHRTRGRDPETKLKHTFIEWIEPAPDGWTGKMLADMRKSWEAAGAVRVS